MHRRLASVLRVSAFSAARRRAPAAALITLLALLSVLASGLALFGKVLAQVEAPLIPQASGEQCVADTDLMRREHMVLMNHQRDETVIEGVRGNPYSLTGCVDCHVQNDAQGNAIRVDAEGQFCQSCHAYAAVKIDCFGCHAAVPTAPLPDSHKESASVLPPRLPPLAQASHQPAPLPWSDLHSSLPIQSLRHGNERSNASRP